MLALFRKAYRDVTKRRVRSLLTLLGILIGVAGVVAIVSTGQNLARAQAAAYADASQADISYWVWDAPASLERAVEGIDNVSAAELRGDFPTRCSWDANGETVAKDVSVKGVPDFATMRVDQILLREGRFPREGEFAAEQSALDIAPLELGDTVTCRGRAGSPDRRLTLVGIVQTPNFPSATLLDYATFYTTSSDVSKLLGTAGVNGLMVKVYDIGSAHDTAAQVTQLLDRRGVSHNAPTIRDPENFLGKRELDSLLTLLGIFSAVGLITSGFLVANTLAAIAAEQVGEIGTLKAIGGTRMQVLTIYLFAALIYGVVGTTLGLIVGVFLSWRLFAYIGSLLNLTNSFQVSPLGIALGTVVGIGVTLCAGAIPAFAATSIPVRRALESYGITPTYGQGRTDRMIQRLSALPPLAAMSVRNLARRKSRALVTMLVIAVSVAASLAAQAVSASVNQTIDGLFRTYRADAWIYFGEYVSTAFENALRGVPGVENTETWSLTSAWVSTDGSAQGAGTDKRITESSPSTTGGSAQGAATDKRMGEAARARLWGLPADTTLYAPKLVAGRWYRADENDGAVISTDMAQNLKLNVGDEISVDSGDYKRPFRVVGIAEDNSVFLGSEVAGKVFMREDIVAQMERREGYATFFALALDRHDPDGVEKRLDEISKRFNRYQVGSDSAAREVRGAREQTRILTIALAAMSVLIGLIGALGVLNTITLSVLERRREIGVLRSMGASDLNVAQIFLTEGLALGVGGWVLGMPMGYLLGMALTRVLESVLFHIDYVFTPQMVLVSLAFALALTLGASLVPALAAARLKVGEVLRYE